MKGLLLIICISTLFSLPAFAKGLFEGVEAKSCFESSPDIHQQNNCISDAADKSAHKLDALIHVTSKRIKAFNSAPFDIKGPAIPTIGDVYSQRFLKAQVIWKRYRNELCLAVAREIYEDSWDYPLFIDQCEINLNKRHMAEIEAMGFDTDE